MSIIQPIVPSALSARIPGSPRRLIMLGESLIGQADTASDSGSDTDLNSNAYGVINWFNILADWPFQYYVRAVDNTPDSAELQGDNKGQSADTISGIKARLAADVLAHAPEVVWLSVGTNDAALETSLVSFAADFDEVCNIILDSGAMLIVDAQHNRTSWSEVASEPLHMAFNRHIREFAARTPGVLLNDTVPAMTDYSDSDGLPQAANVTGTVADDWQVLTDSAEVSAAVSMVDAPADAPWMVGKWLKVDVTSSGSGSAGTRVRLYKTGSTKMSDNYTIGDYYEAVCGAKVEAPGSNSIMQDFGLKLQANNGSSVQTLNNRSGEFMPDAAWFGMLKTQPLQANSASDGFYLQLNVEFDGSVSGTQSFYVGQMAFYKMPHAPGF